MLQKFYHERDNKIARKYGGRIEPFTLHHSALHLLRALVGDVLAFHG